MGMGKPDVCRITELSLPIPAVRSIRKRDNGKREKTMRQIDSRTVGSKEEK
jgi:hypothetical protein